MIVYRAQFPISKAASSIEVFRIGKSWIAGSPHSLLKKDVSRLNEGELIACVEVDGEKMETLHYQDRQEEIFGIFYQKKDAELEWVTQIVACKKDEVMWASVQISCESDHSNAEIPRPKKPYIMRHFAKHMAGGMDGEIPCSSKPIFLNSADVVEAVRMMSAASGNLMPVVYLSCSNSESHAVSPAKLAQHLYGIAHVVVEPSREFSYRLKVASGSRNAYGGAVGIYWPGGGFDVLYRNEGHQEFIDRVSAFVHAAIVGRRLRKECTWSYLEQRIFGQKLDLMKSSSAGADEYVALFDSEMQIKNEELKEAELEIQRLTAEAARLSSKVSSDVSGGILSRGGEIDLYEGEAADIILGILRRELESAALGARKIDVLRAIVEVNSVGGRAKELKEKIKALFSSYTGWNARVKKDVVALGFDYQEDGKHIKLYWSGDKRYMVTIPKTPGDVRSGLNIVSDINRTAF